jgi:hypothetical protein
MEISNGPLVAHSVARLPAKWPTCLQLTINPTINLAIKVQVPGKDSRASIEHKQHRNILNRLNTLRGGFFARVPGLIMPAGA